MPPVLIDISRLLSRKLLGRIPTGIDRVGLAYLRHYRQNARAVLSLRAQSRVLSARDTDRACDLLLGADSGGAAASLRLWTSASLFGWWPHDVDGRVLFHTGHMGLEHPGYATRLRQGGARLVSVVHDLIPITHPEYCRPGRRERHIRRIGNIVRTSSAVIVNSRHTGEVLQGYCDRSGLRPPQILVAPLATELPAPTGPATRPDDPYFIVLGSIEPRKNHWMLLQIWRRLVERLGSKAPKLVIIGRRAWECENVVDLLERCEALRGFIVELPDCGDQELVNLLSGARALLFPSFVEGYGLPVAEALSLGVPVIASDLPVFREFAGDIPDYIDPLDGRLWLDRIEDYARPDGERRRAQLSRITSFVVPTWAEHFTRVDSLIATLSNGPSAAAMFSS